MENNEKYEWVSFYKELAERLLGYKNNREKLIEKVKAIYENSGISMPTLELNNDLVDIDPFTIFGIFNKSSMKESNRIKLLTAVADLFDVKAPIPRTFNSIPVLNNQNATFYYFIDKRGSDDIDDLWGLFETALAYAKDPSEHNCAQVSRFFDLAINRKGNGNSKITMGLYWIAPDSFLNLDSRNTWYIYESGKLPAELVQSLPAIEQKIPAKKYFDIVGKLRSFLKSGNSKLKDFKDLSFEAWIYSDQVNDERKAEKEAELKRGNTGKAVADEDVSTTHYWLYAPGDGATYWDEFYNDGIIAIGWDEIGDLSTYSNKNEIKKAMREKYDPTKSHKNSAHATWQFANEMKIGDVIFAKKGMNSIVGRGIVESDYEFDPSRPYFNNIRKVNWTDKGEWKHPGQAAIKTLTDITAYTDYVDSLKALFEEDVDSADDEKSVDELKPYTKADFLKDVYIDEDQYENLVARVRKKKNVILEGAPGVGKTFVAKRLAYSIMGVKDPERVMMVQFHQSYSYEDFIMGFRPTQGGGFELKKGAFYNFCKSAEIDSEDTPYFFIIDEINRGNLSKIFGELFMLIEADKRGIELKLLYADENFSIPKNVYIIGMMNTADRSLAMLDYALRRRFAFYDMKPGFDSKGFKEYKQGLDSERFNNLVSCIELLNSTIASDDSLGEGFCIGHSYLCNLNETSYQTLAGIVDYEIVPLLREYWFDEPVKVRDWTERLKMAIK